MSVFHIQFPNFELWCVSCTGIWQRLHIFIASLALYSTIFTINNHGVSSALLATYGGLILLLPNNSPMQLFYMNSLIFYSSPLAQTLPFATFCVPFTELTKRGKRWQFHDNNYSESCPRRQGRSGPKTFELPFCLDPYHSFINVLLRICLAKWSKDLRTTAFASNPLTL